MSAVMTQSAITPGDRFGMTLCLAILCHAIIILGITFSKEDTMVPKYDTMEIILVTQSDPEADTDARLLAQANLSGGGDTDDNVTPTTPVQPPFPSPEQDLVSSPPEMKQVDPVQPGSDIVEEETSETPARTQEQLVVEKHSAETPAAVQEKKPAESRQANRPTAAELLRNSFKIAALSTQIKEKMEARSQRPRRTFISASTRSYKYAAYMEAWRAKVERVGNLNYPDEARQRKLSGSLILDVALNPDGTVNQITIRKSSGQKVLDDAAIRIVNLASPYAPFPDGIRKDTDILHITRTWQFLNNASFR